MQGVPAGENCGRPVVAVDMKKGPDTFHRIRRIRQRDIGAIDLIVLSAHRQCEAVARTQDNRRRPYFDIELDLYARSKRPCLIMRMPGPIRPRKSCVKLSMRGT